MTTTLPTGGPSIAGGPPRVRLDARPGTIYGYRIRDPRSGTVRIDYVGQTRNLARRDGQHRGLIRQRDGRFREQPWSDLIEGGPVVLESGVWTDTELDAAEIGQIHALLPRMNYRDSVTPDRIPIYTQHEQRKVRDPAWVIPDWSRRGPSATVLPRPEPSRPVSGRPETLWARLWATSWGRRLSAWLLTAAKVSAVWLVLSVAVTWGLVVYGFPLGDVAVPAAIGVAGLLGWLLKPKRSRRGGRTDRTTRRRRT